MILPPLVFPAPSVILLNVMEPIPEMSELWKRMELGGGKNYESNLNLFVRCHNIPHNDTQHNDTQHNDTQYNDTRRNILNCTSEPNIFAVTMSFSRSSVIIVSFVILLYVWTCCSECHYGACHGATLNAELLPSLDIYFLLYITSNCL